MLLTRCLRLAATLLILGPAAYQIVFGMPEWLCFVLLAAGASLTVYASKRERREREAGEQDGGPPSPKNRGGHMGP